MSVKDWRPDTKKGDVRIRRVGGAQAQMALENLDLVKVDTASAEILFGADVPFVIAPSKVNSYHFFGGVESGGTSRSSSNQKGRLDFRENA